MAARGLCRKCYNDLPENKEQAIRARRLKKYGLSEEAYRAILEDQGWKCAICGGEPTHLDHDHDTGLVRGLLCRPCNIGIGHLRNDPGLLRSAARYLSDRSAVAVGGFIQTFTGRAMFPFNPRPEQVDHRDIAHALSAQCRFTGHVRKFLSVAEHSVRVSELLEAMGESVDVQLWGLLHDASEAYLVDVPSPVKRAPGMEAYREAENNLQRVICRKFGLSLNEPESVVLADRTMLTTEARDLMPQSEECWGQWFRDYPPLPDKIQPMSPGTAEKAFLRAFKRLRP